MSIQVSTSTPTAFRSDIHPTVYVRGAQASAQTAKASQTAAVCDIDPASAVKSLSVPDAPLSDAELEQLFTVFKSLGADNDLWKDIGNLLSEFSGDDRTNFLSVLSRAGDNITGVVSQLSRLDTDDRSVFLRTAVRLDPDEGLKNLVRSVGQIKGETLTAYLNMADGLGRSFASLKGGELKNFIKAGAQSPEAIADLTRKTSELDEEDLTLFLKAAATAGDDLGRFISTLDNLAVKNLTPFLSAAAKAGEGLSNLLDLTQKADTDEREHFLSFISALSEKETLNFLSASQGTEETAEMLMETSQRLSGTERGNFLALSARAQNSPDSQGSLDRLVALVNSLSADPEQRADFLTTAVNAQDMFGQVLDLAEFLSDESGARVFSFASDLGFADLASFITAATGSPDKAGDLADAAGALQGVNKSYLLYAAAIHPGEVSRLTDLAGELEGQDLENFLFTAANTDDDTSMADLLSQTNRLAGSERSEFLKAQREQLAADGNAMAQEFVYLNSAYSGDRFDTLLAMGPNRIHEVLSDLDGMDETRRSTFFSLANAAGKDGVQTLVNVMGKLDETQTQAFQNLAGSLDKEGQRDLVKAAGLALSQQDRNSDSFDRLIATAKQLPSASGKHFLHAAAVAGNTLETLMDLTHDLGGINKTNFLIGAAGTADVDDGGRLLQAHVRATDYIFNDILGNIQELNDTKEGIRPSQIINSRSGQLNTNNKSNTVNPTLYLESAAFLAIQPDISYGLRMNWYNGFMGIPAQGY